LRFHLCPLDRELRLTGHTERREAQQTPSIVRGIRLAPVSVMRRFLGSLTLLCWLPLAARALASDSLPGNAPAAEHSPAGRLSLVALEREPPRPNVPTAADLAALRKAVDEAPRLRKPRFDLVQALFHAGRLDEAREEAERFREQDAYNLVAVRLLGDILVARGETKRARRTYSAIVELLPRDVEARRALATVLKQAGDLESARAQLRAALELTPADRRTEFELGDVEYRLGMVESARGRFEATATAPDVNTSLSYPAKQRLGQIYATRRRQALSAGKTSEAAELGDKLSALGIAGGVENDIKVYLSWDTDRTDVDLWVTTPRGEKIFYSHKQGRGGEALFDDVTSGYGPESFTAPRAQSGEYTIQVQYYGSRASAFKEARGEVIVLLNEGRADERRHVLPYRLFEEKQVVTVAKVRAEAGGER